MPSPESYVELMRIYPELMIFTAGVAVALLCGAFQFGLAVFTLIQMWREN